jgi:Amt family ammonium transporter
MTQDVFACHGVGGITGMILTAILPMVKMRVYYTEVGMCLNHMMALILVSVYTFFGAYILFKITNRIIPCVFRESGYGAGFVPT